MKTILHTLLLATALTSFSSQSESSPIWQLDTEASQLSYVSTKNKTVAENNTIQFQSGVIAANDSADHFDVNLTLDLATVDTQIPIRDERIKSHLFKTEEHPVATITAQIPKHLPINEATTLPFKLSLHGHDKTYETPVMIHKVKGNMVVTSYVPVLIHARDHGLNDGIDTLLSLAKLQAISYEVPVDFKLVFHKINQPSQQTKDQ